MPQCHTLREPICLGPNGIFLESVSTALEAKWLAPGVPPGKLVSLQLQRVQAGRLAQRLARLLYTQ